MSFRHTDTPSPFSPSNYVPVNISVAAAYFIHRRRMRGLSPAESRGSSVRTMGTGIIWLSRYLSWQALFSWMAPPFWFKAACFTVSGSVYLSIYHVDIYVSIMHISMYLSRIDLCNPSGTYLSDIMYHISIMYLLSIYQLSIYLCTYITAPVIDMLIARYSTRYDIIANYDSVIGIVGFI